MLEPKCSICKVIKKEIEAKGTSKLQKRLNRCKKFNPQGESQAAIAREFGFSVISLSLHLKKHQSPRGLDKINERFDIIQKKEVITHQEGRAKMIEIGMQALEDGNMKLSGAVLRGVLKDEMDYEMKKEDRQIEVMKLLFEYASGDKKIGEPSRIGEPKEGNS